MDLLPLLLFIFGCISFVWAFKIGNTSGKSSPETLTILQGLAGVKKEVSQGQKSLREVQTQLGDHELRLYRIENVQEDLRGELEELKKTAHYQAVNNSSFQPQVDSTSYPQSYMNSISYSPTQPQPQPQPQPQLTDPRSFFDKPDLNPGQPLPEKYRKVLELSQFGWSVSEIAGHMGVSQDAVSMVLRTASVGKGPSR